MATIDLPPDDLTMKVWDWLEKEIYPGLLQEPFDQRAAVVWVSGSNGFVGRWARGDHAGEPPEVRMVNIQHEIFRTIYGIKFPQPDVEPGTGEAVNRQPKGVTRLGTRGLRDDNGAYLGLKYSFFWSPRAHRDHPDRWAGNQKWGAANGFNAYRGIALSGGWPAPDPWEFAGAPKAWALQQLPLMLRAGLQDYRMRCSLTIFDGFPQVETFAEQDQIVNGVCDVILANPDTIQDLQMANEYGPTGWNTPQGIGWLREHVRTIRRRLPNIILSVSSTNAAMGDFDYDPAIAEAKALYGGDILALVNAAADHDSRWVAAGGGKPAPIDGPWRHVRKGWERVLFDRDGKRLTPDAGSDDEPMGPRSSVAEENNPSRIVGKAVVSWVSGRFDYCYHPDAGIWSDLLHPHYKRGGGGWRPPDKGEYKLVGDHPASTLVGLAFRRLLAVLPGDLPNWSTTRHGRPHHPFGKSFQQQADGRFTQIWVDGHTAHGVVRSYVAYNGANFVAPLTGLRDRLDMAWDDPFEAAIYKCGDGSQAGEITRTMRTFTVRESTDTDLVVVGTWV